MRRLIWSEVARKGLATILDPFVDERPDLIANAIVQIGRLEKLLIDTPGIGAPLDEVGLRKLRVGRTSILLIYRIDGPVITVVQVHHAASDWKVP
ncbi:type II toxin-antitoxin system RelE/ParE family toxin [Sphingomonas lacunae]|uniref:Type II toxin-antitoxin system RelE/ParE family toxin n=1 Tax=Sphingomonas lacunae TaxID=2698828 RepID=A0A6M4AU38_9SPHN|nr:type II toxin-antitoxin system RelE/ParE family toxin [Sphingomonas lacunae]QJQ32256.1 type II toxin-antitoxin system RelE/ParE family toxin [Sphingomonas lacunae]